MARTPITPSVVSWSGFVLTCGAAALIIARQPFTAGFVVLVAGYLDILDGALARLTGKVTPFGAVLDSTLDRLSEAAALIAVLALFPGSVWVALLVSLALIASFLVSYVRARAEAIGLDCRVGVFTRTERVIALALGLLLSDINNALIIALAIIVAFSLFTAGQRLVYVWRQKKN